MAKRYSFTVQEVLQWASSFLDEQLANTPQKVIEASDKQLVLERLLRHEQNWDKTQWLLHGQVAVEWDLERLSSLLNLVAQGMPLQYILGEEQFFQRSFIVNPSVLIPRPETEELVLAVVDFLNRQADTTVLEIGVGSGCIIHTLALECPHLRYVGSDTSSAALEVARQNQVRLNVGNVSLVNSDVWSEINSTEKYIAIVSNPPYISESERGVMDQSVLDYEPAVALFADDDGLAMYQRMAEQLERYLLPNGRAFFEIGYQQGKRVKELFLRYTNDRRVEIKQDLAGHDRMVIVYEQKTKER